MRLLRTTTTTAAALLLCAGVLMAQTAPPEKSGLVDPNTASQTELSAVPHITPAIAKDIAAKRPFKTISDLDAVLQQDKLTPEQLKEVYGRMFAVADVLRR